MEEGKGTGLGPEWGRLTKGSGLEEVIKLSQSHLSSPLALLTATAIHSHL